MTQTDKYRFALNVLSIFAALAVIVSLRFTFKGWHRRGGFFGLIVSLFILGTFRKGVCALKRKNIKGFKCFLKMAAAVFIISIYNLLMFIVMGKRRRCMFGFFGLLAMIFVSGGIVRRGRRLFRSVLKAEWRAASNQDDSQVIRVEPQ